MQTTQTMTKQGAAKAIGITPGRISQLVKAGIIRTVTTADGFELIPVAEVERLQREARPTGRPRKDA